MKVFYTEGTTFITPKAPTRAEGDKSGLCVETLGTIHIRGDNSDPDNIQSDQVQYWYSMPDDMDISDTFTGEDQVPVVYPDATKIAEVRKQLHVQKCINDVTQQKIREKYSVEDELKAQRTGDTDFVDYVKACCAEGDVKKVKLGLKE